MQIRQIKRPMLLPGLNLKLIEFLTLVVADLVLLLAAEVKDFDWGYFNGRHSFVIITF